MTSKTVLTGTPEVDSGLVAEMQVLANGMPVLMGAPLVEGGGRSVPYVPWPCALRR